MTRKPTDAVPDPSDAERVRRATKTFGTAAIAAESGLSNVSILRIAAGSGVKRATLMVVLAAVDRLEAARAAKLNSEARRVG